MYNAYTCMMSIISMSFKVNRENKIYNKHSQECNTLSVFLQSNMQCMKANKFK